MCINIISAVTPSQAHLVCRSEAQHEKCWVWWCAGEGLLIQLAPSAAHTYFGNTKIMVTQKIISFYFNAQYVSVKTDLM